MRAGRARKGREANGGGLRARTRVCAQLAQHLDRLAVARARARDADGHRGAVAHVRVVRLGEQRHHARALRRLVAQDEAERGHGCAPHVFGHVGDRDLEHAPDGRIGRGAGVGEREHVGAAVAQDVVLREQQLADRPVRLLLAPVEDDSHAERQRPDARGSAARGGRAARVSAQRGPRCTQAA